MTPTVRRRRPLLLPALALAGAVLGSSAVARADAVSVGSASPGQTKEATAHFLAGKHARDAKDFDRAVQELRASLDIVDSPNARLELARSLRDQGTLGDAWTEYGRTVDDAKALVATIPRYQQTADAAKSERAAIESKVALVSVTVSHAPPGAELKVGGRLVPPDRWSAPASGHARSEGASGASSGPFVASPGAVDVVLVDADGKELARQTVAAAAGQKVSAALDAQPPPAAPPPPETADDKPDVDKAPAPSPEPSGRSALRPYAYAAGAVGVAGLAAFTVFGILSNNDFADLKNACPGGRCPSSKAGEISDGKTFQTVANVGLGVGIAGVAVGATLLVLSLTGHSEAGPAPDSTGLVVGPGYLGLRGTL